MNTEAQELFDYLAAKYKLHTDKEISVLEMYCGSIVNMRNAQKLVDEQGTCIMDRYGILKANPAMDVVTKNKTQAIAALKLLDLNESEENDVLKDFK